MASHHFCAFEEKILKLMDPLSGWIHAQICHIPHLPVENLRPLHPSRWIKFEEKVEKGGERWSKPHVATLSLHSLFELRTCIEKGTIMLDLEASTLPQVVGKSEGSHLWGFGA